MGISKWVKGLVGSDPRDLSNEATGAAAAANHVARGIAALGENRPDDAVNAFHEAVRLDPFSATNHVNLAFALQQTDAEHGAMRHLRRAAELDPNSFDARYMLGTALDRDEDHEGAIAHLREAVRLQPEFEPARIALCRLLASSGKLVEARQTIEAALALNPDNADVHQYLGNLCMAEKSPETALASYRRALTLLPSSAQVYSNLGLALHATGALEHAAESFEAALTLDPSLREGHYGLAITRKAQGRIAEAINSMQRSAQLDPRHVDTMNELGGLALDQGLIGEAIHFFERVVALSPDKPGGYTNLGLALVEQGDIGRALTVYRQGLAVEPIASLHDNLGVALMRQGFTDEGIVELRKAIELKPNNINTWINLAVALTEGVGHAEGVTAYRELLTRDPSQLKAHSNLLFNLSYSQVCSPKEYLVEAAAFDAKLPRARVTTQPPMETMTSGRRLRVGFVSGDLCEHPVGFFLEGILHELDQHRLELFAYPSAAKHDALSARIKPRFAQWRLLTGMDDEAAARLIRDDRIDVLIDLAGHSAHNRLPMFALRPAPLQVTWLGYFASTGVREMDYILVDDGCVPESCEHFLSERVWRMPHTRLCYTPPSDRVAPAVAPLPALSNGHVTFGCFQRFTKINDTVVSAWGRIFAALPQARLLLQSQLCVSPSHVERMLARLADVGITKERVTTQPTVPVAAYFASYSQIDIALDTFPFNGGTTTCEALWMGVPTLTVTGDTMLARQGAALLAAGGLAEWAAGDIDDYVDRAIRKASDIGALATLRANMRERMRSSPLFDARRFARDFEQSLTGMWQQKMSEAHIQQTV